MSRGVSRWFDRLAGRRWLAVLLPGALVILLRLAILPWHPVPDPMAPDEFSQLFAAKTFASGRATNPTPPFGVHFETPYILLEPTFASKYPPGPPLLMALGILAAGSAWAGVVLGTGLMCSGICWMLQGWLPARWVLAGAMLVVARYSLHHYWLNSYWGGSLAAFGGALVFGALPRLLRGGTVGPAVVMASGIAILAVSRPYEGLLFSIVPGAVLLTSLLRSTRRRFLAVASSIAVVAIIAAVPYAWYNWRVTGSPTTLPYAAYTKQYEPVPHFIWQPPRTVRPFVHRELANYLSFRGVVERQKTVRGAATRALEITGVSIPSSRRMLMHPKVIANMVFGIALLASAVFLIRDRSMRIPLITTGVVIVGMIPGTFFFDHYAAPAIGVMFLIVVQALRRVALLRFWRRGLGRAIPALLSIGALAAVLLYSVLFLPFGTPSPQYITVDRPRVAAHVSRFPGKHLILVRFGSDFTIDDGEWIYNEPDLENSRVIWARDMGRHLNARLLEHFKDRQVWYVYKNREPARVYRAGTATDPLLTAGPEAVTAALRLKE